MEQVDYKNIDGLSELGCFFAHHGSRNTVSLTPYPVLKITKLKSKANYQFNYYIPGFMTIQNIFYEMPLCIFNAYLYRVKELLFKESYFGVSKLKITLILFDKNDEFKKYVCLVEKDERSKNFALISCLINVYNLLLASGKTINELHFPARITSKTISTGKKEIIIELVEKLEFVFYVDSYNRPGKDNIFTEQAEIYQLPSEIYFVELIKFSLKKQCAHLAEIKDGLIMSFNNDYAWSPSTGRRKIGPMADRAKKIKEILKLDMAIEYDSKKHLMSRFIK